MWLLDGVACSDWTADLLVAIWQIRYPYILTSLKGHPTKEHVALVKYFTF